MWRLVGSHRQCSSDLVMWGGHTGLVVKVCGNGSYQMTAMGNSGARVSPCLTPSQMASWGSGGWLGMSAHPSSVALSAHPSPRLRRRFLDSAPVNGGQI